MSLRILPAAEDEISPGLYEMILASNNAVTDSRTTPTTSRPITPSPELFRGLELRFEVGLELPERDFFLVVGKTYYPQIERSQPAKM